MNRLTEENQGMREQESCLLLNERERGEVWREKEVIVKWREKMMIVDVWISPREY